MFLFFLINYIIQVCNCCYLVIRSRSSYINNKIVRESVTLLPFHPGIHTIRKKIKKYSPLCLLSHTLVGSTSKLLEDGNVNQDQLVTPTHLFESSYRALGNHQNYMDGDTVGLYLMGNAQLVHSFFVCLI